MDQKVENVTWFALGAAFGAAVTAWVLKLSLHQLEEDERPVIVVSNGSLEFTPEPRRGSWIQSGNGWQYQLPNAKRLTSLRAEIRKAGGGIHSRDKDKIKFKVKFTPSPPPPNPGLRTGHITVEVNTTGPKPELFIHASGPEGRVSGDTLMFDVSSVEKIQVGGPDEEFDPHPPGLGEFMRIRQVT